MDSACYTDVLLRETLCAKRKNFIGGFSKLHSLHIFSISFSMRFQAAVSALPQRTVLRNLILHFLHDDHPYFQNMQNELPTTQRETNLYKVLRITKNLLVKNSDEFPSRNLPSHTHMSETVRLLLSHAHGRVTRQQTAYPASGAFAGTPDAESLLRLAQPMGQTKQGLKKSCGRRVQPKSLVVNQSTL